MYKEETTHTPYNTSITQGPDSLCGSCDDPKSYTGRTECVSQ